MSEITPLLKISGVRWREYFLCHLLWTHGNKIQKKCLNCKSYIGSSGEKVPFLLCTLSPPSPLHEPMSPTARKQSLIHLGLLGQLVTCLIVMKYTLSVVFLPLFDPGSWVSKLTSGLSPTRAADLPSALLCSYCRFLLCLY